MRSVKVLLCTENAAFNGVPGSAFPQLVSRMPSIHSYYGAEEKGIGYLLVKSPQTALFFPTCSSFALLNNFQFVLCLWFPVMKWLDLIVLPVFLQLLWCKIRLIKVLILLFWEFPRAICRDFCSFILNNIFL